MNRSAAVIVVLSFLLCGCSQAGSFIPMTEIPAGTFTMGGPGGGDRADEGPAHQVSLSAFKMSTFEITNSQYEVFSPEHRALRGKDGVSTGDNEAVVNVSWEDAAAFCRWLSRKERKHYRLPTEAEWEYACRAGTTTEFFTGDTLPSSFLKHQEIVRDYAPVSLEVGKTEPNAFGLYDMHGNVEEWCGDWYGLYCARPVSDPCGPSEGEYKVTRGGSHNTPVQFLRSSNRMAMLPSDRHSLTGFRIVESSTRLHSSGRPLPVPLNMLEVGQEDYDWNAASTGAVVENSSGQVSADSAGSTSTGNYAGKSIPLFAEPIPYVIEPKDDTPFYSHNHQPAITWCDNGDLLAIWFSANAENGREMVVLASRLRAGNNAWDEASLFFKVPDRNMTGSSLLNDGAGRLLHMNGVEAAGDWQNLAMVLRISEDNGATWSEARLVAPEHRRRHQVIPGPIVTREGYYVQLCDAGADGNAGSAIHISRDGGKTWADPSPGHELPGFEAGKSGHTIAGIHAGIVQREDGSLMAFGRGNSIPDEQGRPRMPVSTSSDWGESWKYAPSEFPPIGSGQRLVLLRLREGPILLVSFTDQGGEEEGMVFHDSKGRSFTGHGMFAALSYDDGFTWPVRKLFVDGKRRELDGGAWTGKFTMDASHAEPKGYLAAVQSPDGVIHVVSSRMHYRVNLAWLEE